MTEYIHLVGAEEVQRAAHTMESAAEAIQRAVSSFECSTELLIRAMEAHAYAITQALAEKEIDHNGDEP